MRYSDLEVVDYFEVYPLIDAPRAYLPLISSENYFTVDNVVFEFYDDNYIVYPEETEFHKSGLVNLKTKIEDLERSIFAFPYNANISTRANHQTCSQSRDNGGIWCYARRSKGIYNFDITIPTRIRGEWQATLTQSAETRAARFQSGIWWSFSVDEVNTEVNFEAVINAGGVVITDQFDLTLSNFNTNSNSITDVNTILLWDSFVEIVSLDGNSIHNIIDTGSNFCDPREYDITCQINHAL